VTPTVRSLAEHDDSSDALETFHRIGAAAFGQPPDAAALEAKRPLIEPARWYLAELEGEPCGGSGSFPFELTVPGGGVVAAAGVSDIGVLPTHRRRGVLGALMARQLADLAGSGHVAAVLHASEAAIYRRFGFGPATRWRQVRIEARRSAFREGWPDPGGSVRLVPRHEALPACASVHDRARRAHPGGLTRSQPWWEIVLGDASMYLGGGSRRLVILHESPQGDVDGYVIYEMDEDWSTGQGSYTLRVWELVGADPSVELALWRTVLDHDLVDRVTGPIAVDHILWDVMVDPRQVRTRWDQDLLWARLLDVPAALSSRSYGSPGRLTIEVEDRSRPAAAATFGLEYDGRVATCLPIEGAADLRVDVADLGACWLGGGSFRRLVRAGAVVELSPGAAATGDVMFRTDPAPWCWVRF
jgi:predicted acetyltransferase